jgi:hypothetical protein
MGIKLSTITNAAKATKDVAKGTTEGVEEVEVVEDAKKSSKSATAASPSVRTKARQGTQAVQKGQEPRPPLRGDTFAPGTTAVTQAPLYTPDEGITPDLKRYADLEWDPLGRPLGAQYFRRPLHAKLPGQERMSEVMPEAYARRVAKHTVYGPDGEEIGRSLPPDKLDPLIGASTADKPIGGYTIGDQKPQEWRSERYTSPTAVAARLMDPHPPRGDEQRGDTTFEGEGAIEEAFGMIDPIEFNVDGSLAGTPSGAAPMPGPSIWTVGELSQHFDYLSIPVLRQYQGYLNRSLNEIDKADRKLADHAATLRGLAEYQSPGGLSRQQHKELHRRRSATLREREAAIKQQQEQAQRLSALMKAMAKRAGVTDEELK